MSGDLAGGVRVPSASDLGGVANVDSALGGVVPGGVTSGGVTSDVPSAQAGAGAVTGGVTAAAGTGSQAPGSSAIGDASAQLGRATSARDAGQSAIADPSGEARSRVDGEVRGAAEVHTPASASGAAADLAAGSEIAQDPRRQADGQVEAAIRSGTSEAQGDVQGKVGLAGSVTVTPPVPKK